MEGEPGQPVEGQPNTPEETELPDGSTAQQSPRTVNWEKYAPRSTVLTLWDFAEIPRQILPDETYTHLKNARTEARLALSSLAESIGSTLAGALREIGKTQNRGITDSKTHKRINVE